MEYWRWGGAADLKEVLDEAGEKRLEKLAASIGITCFTLEDDVYLQPQGNLERHGLKPSNVRQMVEGDHIREWSLRDCEYAVWPYDSDFRILDLSPHHEVTRFLWRYRSSLSNNMMFGGKTKVQCGLRWYEFGRLTAGKLRTPLTLAFGEVATHNHFVLDRGGKIFSRSANVLKLPDGASDSDYQALLGLLNSSTACFWQKQVCFPKGGDHQGTEGARVRTTLWDERYSFNSTQVGGFPIPAEKPLGLAKELDRCAQELKSHTAARMLAGDKILNLDAKMVMARAEFIKLRERMLLMQEELDWECYRLYGLLSENVNLASSSLEFAQIQLRRGERAFEIVMARKMAQGELETVWFSRHGSTPITELPAHWPAAYRQLVERRIAIIESDRNIALIEQPEYKRRWNTEPWEEQQERALRAWLLSRLEGSRHWPSVELTSCAHLADKVRSDVEFMEVATLYRGRPDFDITELVVELVESEAMPFLPVLRYKESGLRKRAIWEQVWDLQRREDGIEAEVRGQGAAAGGEAQQQTEIKRRQKQEVGDIPVPPKYDTKDFVSTTCWRLRGKLDVPKERFITYPHCNRDADRTPVIGWAGWDHLQQAQAVAGYYERMRTNEGWTDDRLLPLLAGVLELLPWLLQWHNGLDPQYGMGLGDFFRSFAEEEARRMGKTLDEVRAWQPPAKPGRKKKQPNL